MKLIQSICALAIATTLVAAPAAAAVIDFEGVAPPNGTVLYTGGGTYVEDGYTLDIGFGFLADSGFSLSFSATMNGTDYLTSSAMILHKGGASFSLHQLDFGSYTRFGSPHMDVVGTFAGGGTIATQIHGGPGLGDTILFSGWDDLVSVRFASISGQSDQTEAFDNIVVSMAAVPLPASLPLLAGAAALLGLVRRRRG